MRQKGKRFFVDDSKKSAKKPKAAPQPTEAKDIEDGSQSDVIKSETATTKPIDFGEAKDKIAADKSKAQKAPKSFEKSKKTDKQKKIKPPKTKKTSKRKVLSFEDLPLDSDGNNRMQKMMKTVRYNRKSILLAVIIVAVLTLSVLLFANRDRLTFSNLKNWVEYGVLNTNSEEHFPVSTEGAVINNGNFSRIDSNLVFASDTEFVTLNNYGRTIYRTPQSFSSPVLCKAGDCDLSLVYNLGGTEFSINTLDSTEYVAEAEDNIIVADISKSGVYAIVTEKDGYLAKLYVYSKEHEQIYAYSFADYYVTSVSLDSTGRKAVVSGVSAHNGSQISAVYALDFTKEEPVIFEEIENNIIYYVKHLNDNYVCVIGENTAYTLSLRTKTFKSTPYEGKTLTSFDVNTDTNTYSLSLSRSADGRMCDVLNFTTTGKLRKVISTDLMITSMSTYKNRVAVLSGNTVYLYSKDGTELSRTQAGLDPHCVMLYSTTDAYVLGVSEIRRIDL